MSNYKRRLRDLEEKIDRLDVTNFTFPTTDGRTVELDMSDVMKVYRAASKKAWQDEPIDRENELIKDVLQAKRGDHIGNYLKSLVAGEGG